MQKRRYSAKYFKENFPEWKRKKDSFLVKHFYRPISFFTASFATKIGLGANDISFLSALVAIFGSLMYAWGIKWLNIVGAILINVWMIFDCTDGNIARSVKKEPLGEFADASSSYILINLLFSFLGIAAYRSKGLFISSGCWWILFLGVFAGGSDSLSRLLYQKFINIQKAEHKDNDDQNAEKKQGKLVKLHDRIDKELGLNGIFLPALLIVSITDWFDIFVVFYAIFYLGSLISTYMYFVYKCYKSKNYDVNNS